MAAPSPPSSPPPPRRQRTLELCVESVHGIQAALAGGADRIELCAALALGGLTPSVGLMEQAVALARDPAYPRRPMEVMAMVRPRLGDFVYTAPEIAAMCADIRAARAAGVDGVVLGVSDPSGQVDEAQLAELVRVAKDDRERPLSVTLHRAIDLSPDPVAAVDMAARAGVDRILTSGGGRGAMEGAAVIAQMVQRAGGRVSIMAGAGLQPWNLKELVEATGVREVHGTCSEAGLAVQLSASAGPVVERAKTFGFFGPIPRGLGPRETKVEMVRAMRQALEALPPPRPGEA